jgi:hypothetical protein
VGALFEIIARLSDAHANVCRVNAQQAYANGFSDAPSSSLSSSRTLQLHFATLIQCCIRCIALCEMQNVSVLPGVSTTNARSVLKKVMDTVLLPTEGCGVPISPLLCSRLLQALVVQALDPYNYSDTPTPDADLTIIAVCVPILEAFASERNLILPDASRLQSSSSNAIHTQTPSNGFDEYAASFNSVSFIAISSGISSAPAHPLPLLEKCHLSLPHSRLSLFSDSGLCIASTPMTDASNRVDLQDDQEMPVEVSPSTSGVFTVLTYYFLQQFDSIYTNASVGMQPLLDTTESIQHLRQAYATCCSLGEFVVIQELLSQSLLGAICRRAISSLKRLLCNSHSALSEMYRLMLSRMEYVENVLPIESSVELSTTAASMMLGGIRVEPVEELVEVLTHKQRLVELASAQRLNDAHSRLLKSASIYVVSDPAEKDRRVSSTTSASIRLSVPDTSEYAMNVYNARLLVDRLRSALNAFAVEPNCTQLQSAIDIVLENTTNLLTNSSVTSPSEGLVESLNLLQSFAITSNCRIESLPWPALSSDMSPTADPLFLAFLSLTSGYRAMLETHTAHRKIAKRLDDLSKKRATSLSNTPIDLHGLDIALKHFVNAAKSTLQLCSSSSSSSSAAVNGGELSDQTFIPSQPLPWLCLASVFAQLANCTCNWMADEGTLQLINNALGCFMQYAACRRRTSDNKFLVESEIDFNLGRLYWELGLNSCAELCYLRSIEDIANSTTAQAIQLKSAAAYNLSRLYQQDGTEVGDKRALEIMLAHLVI